MMSAATTKEASIVAATHTAGSDARLPSSASGSDDVSHIHGTPRVFDNHDGAAAAPGTLDTDTQPRRRKRERFGYLTTKDFWLVLLLGQILALGVTGTNTLTTLLVNEGTSIPAFQTFFCYALLNLIFTSFTVYKYGFQGWARMIWKDGWKCESFRCCSFHRPCAPGKFLPLPPTRFWPSHHLCTSTG